MKKLLGLFLAFALVFGAALFIAPPLLLQSRPTEKLIAEKLEQMTGAKLVFGAHQSSYFPFLTARFQNVKIVSEGRRPFAVEAAELRIRLARIPLLLGRTEISHLSLNGIRGNLPATEAGTENFEIHDASLKAGPLRAGRPIRVSFLGSLNQNRDALSAKAVLKFKSLEKLSWEGTSLDAVLNVQEVPLKILQQTIQKYLRVELAGGSWGGQWTFHKDDGGEIVKAHAEGTVKNFTYHLSGTPQETLAPAFDIGFRYQVNWNPLTEVFNVQTAALSMPSGRIEASGNLFGNSEGVQDLRVTATDVVLESIPQYFVKLKDAIPFNIGFSGLSNLEMSVSGTWKQLSVHAKLDLTRALLTYARYFSKPKDLPFDVVLDYQLKDKKNLTGDFSIRFKEMTMKGSLLDLNLGNGEGQLNVITNKFPIAEWENFIPLFQGYKIGGDLKLLANFKGNLQKLYETKSMFNFTLENGRIAGPKGKEMKEIKLSLDLSPLSLEIRDSHFKTGEYELSGSLMAYNLPISPITRLSLNSEQVDAAELYGVLRDLSEPWLQENFKKPLDDWGNTLLSFSPAGETWKNFSVEMTYENGDWKVPTCRFDAYQGSLTAEGGWTSAADAAGAQWDLKVDRLNLARFGRRGGQEKSPVEGNLFLEAHLRAPAKDNLSWQDALEGEGVFLVTNGAFQTFNVLGTVSQIPDFSNVFKMPAEAGSTTFHDLQAEFKVGGRKVTTDKIILLTDDFQCESSGSWAFDGALNYRLNVFLAPESLAAASGQEVKLQEEGLVGPVPLLLSGPLAAPELKPDPAQIPHLLQELLREKRHRALDNFLSEDFFKAPEKP